MELTAAHVGELVRELAPLTSGARVLDAQAHPPTDLLLVLETDDAGTGEDATTEKRVRRVRLSANRIASRLHLQIGPVLRHTGALGPFFRRVASELEDARLANLVQVGGDRIVRLDFARSGSPPRSLVAELTGRHANLVLVDATGKVLDTLVRPEPGTRAAERLGTGATWAPPGGKPPKNAPSEPISESLPAPPSPPEASAALAALAPLSWRVESSVGAAGERQHSDRQRRSLTERLERRLKSARAHRAGLDDKARATDDAERVRMDAELITAHLASLRPGLREIELEDSFTPGSPPRTIALDPGLNPRRNAERLFARAKKLLRSRERLPEEIELAEAQVAGLEGLLARARDDDEDPESVEKEAVDGGWLPQVQKAPERRKPEPRKPYHRFFALRGSEIRVGRSARDNDELTFRASRGNDLWLHTADTPGSHVVLVLEKGAAPDPEEVLDAAHLAAHFSPKRGAQKVNVHVARRKEVHKPRRAKAGLVTLSGGRVQRIRVEEERLTRLLATRGRPRPGSSEAG